MRGWRRWPSRSVDWRRRQAISQISRRPRQSSRRDTKTTMITKKSNLRLLRVLRNFAVFVDTALTARTRSDGHARTFVDQLDHHRLRSRSGVSAAATAADVADCGSWTAAADRARRGTVRAG